MRVAHIITSLGEGGAQAVLFRLCTNDPGNQHTIISLMPEARYGQMLSERGFRVINLDMPRGKFRLGPLWRLWKLLRQERFDIVQTWMYHPDLLGGLVARLAGQRRIFWGIRHTGLEPEHSARSTIWIARCCAWLSPWLPTAIVCCADRAAEVHQAVGYAADKLRVIPNGYQFSQWDTEPDEARALRHSLGIDDDTLLIGMVARCHAQKDHPGLLDAIVTLRQQGMAIRCLLVGDEVTRDNPEVDHWLTRRNLGDSVLALGTRTDIPVVMAALDLHVLSSQGGEGFPNVVAEAMAAGTPCVVTDVGDAARIVADDGWVVPPSDSAALAEAIAAALTERQQHPAAWQERQRRCRRRIRDEYGVARMVSAYTSLWQSTLPAPGEPVAEQPVATERGAPRPGAITSGIAPPTERQSP
ncbi:glycosyltransferase [Halomonas icarae]|uniref:Glycosyltransferase n=1 Tax=Halomonas icarae TaxID=2691040 RepID=A0A7X4VY14_9GAMM|nr:glycosyltransferase [Halomonas icarae]MDR5901271.1 glycosyltransferase [Halomonas icarae]NAW11548.1 glycosyltransferase [Halomonas icarae]